MYYIYFFYITILALIMLYECYQKNYPKWWPMMVLLAPVTTPYFIFKSRKESGIIVFLIFLATFSAVGASEFILFKNYLEEDKQSGFSPLTFQIIHLSEDLKQSTLKLDNALGKLENLSKVQSKLQDIRKAIVIIEQLKPIIAENQDAVNRLEKFTKNYHQSFKGRDLEWVIHIHNFYNDRAVIQHYKSLDAYLFSFQELLEYVHENYLNITEVKSQEQLKNYDEYYIRYRRAVDSHNKFNVRRIEFQNSYLKKYPDIRPYLPGERQTDTFRLWRS
ncbi:MAG: hypothetical protein A2328_06310 [Bdellovibrionales bacterium RIFOXYB2_FULL_36_6]|nr:MAG: hypothetical protein A2328_06310 [Bdellovibrionales bacterium RIFOXYB2_FULL_36_6]